MPVAASDLVIYGSASMPDDDTPTGIGGAIALTKRVVFVDMIPASDVVRAVSDSTGDTTQTVTIYGRDLSGVLVNEVLNLNGTTLQTGTQVFERILKIVLSASAVGIITIDDSVPNVISTMEPGLLEVRRAFYDAAAEAAGGAARTYYEKIFVKNNHATLALTNAQIIEQADPSTKVAFALESTLDGSDTNGAGDRQTHTGGYTFDSATKNVVNSQNLSPLAAQGIWLELSLAAGDAADNTSYTIRTSGQST